MKKFVKMSLVAAVAVAGLTTANAASLEESIKNIDVSGSARLRFHQVEKATGKSADYTKTAYTVDIANKVSDDVTVTTSFYAKGTDTEGDNASTMTDATLNLGGFNVTYTGVANTTIIAGKQALATPFTVAWDPTGVDHTGTGILVVNSSTPVTLIAGYMDEVNDITYATSELAIVGAKASVAGIGLQAWYAKTQLASANQYITTGFYKANYALDLDGTKVAMYAQYATGKTGAVGAKENNVTQLGVSAKMGAIDLGAKYMKIGKNGSLVAFDPTAEAKAGGFEGLEIHGFSASNDKASYMLSAGYAATSSVKVGAWYINADQTTGSDKTELVGYASWAMAKGTKLTAYMGNADDGAATNGLGTVTRIQLDYKF